MEMQPFIKKFKIDDDFYIYDVGTNKFFKVDEPVFHLIDKESSLPLDKIECLDSYSQTEISEAQRTINIMKKEGNFSSHRPKINSFHTGSRDDFIEYQKDILENRLSRITLVVTEACNHRCRYCSYSGKFKYSRKHSDRYMSSDVMRKAVDFYFSHCGKNEKKNISFYGGEPLMNFKLIKECVEYAKSAYSLDTAFNMTINGTLLDKEKVDFLVEHNFSLLVSLDGYKEMHDRYRVFRNGKGTFECLSQKLKSLKKRHPEYYRRKVRFNIVTAPPLNVDKLNDFLENTELKAAAFKFSTVNRRFSSFSQELISKEWDDFWSARATILESFQEKLMNGETLTEIEKSMFQNRFLSIHKRKTGILPKQYPSHGQCPLGERSLLINTDGSFNFCTKVDDTFNLGNVYSGYDFSALMALYDSYGKLLEDQCYNCWAIRLCYKCINDINRNGVLDADLLAKLCSRKKKSILKEIKDYIRIREKNQGALDYLDDVSIS